jgi:cysteinyl-tRNA synthetase
VAQWGSGDELKRDEEIYSHFMNDLDTPKAILRLRAIEKDSSIGAQDKRAIFLYADLVLGLDLDRKPSTELSAEAESLLEDRAAARLAGNWSESDRIRDALAAMKVDVRDSKDGQSWTIKG